MERAYQVNAALLDQKLNFSNICNITFDISEDLRIPPGNRLEKLKGHRRGQYSIHINEQWRNVNRKSTSCDRRILPPLKPLP
ncbi:MAG: type II toxin-antitoxin system RelE/ParE family toxin [Deltaproteobacteria bacterium]|nr:type II toxin-antitoxin system RelE/ParE family toxin [Deltaproteobacteria bacterium]